MQVGQLYVAELCYLCERISSELVALMKLGSKKIEKFNQVNRLIPWQKEKALNKLNIELGAINEAIRFRRELLEKLQNSVGGGGDQKLTLIEILQKGGELI